MKIKIGEEKVYFEEIIGYIEKLAHSDEFYEKLLDLLFTMPVELRNEVAAEWEAQDFDDIVDFIFYIEDQLR